MSPGLTWARTADKGERSQGEKKQRKSGRIRVGKAEIRKLGRGGIQPFSLSLSHLDSGRVYVWHNQPLPDEQNVVSIGNDISIGSTDVVLTHSIAPRQAPDGVAVFDSNFEHCLTKAKASCSRLDSTPLAVRAALEQSTGPLCLSAAGGDRRRSAERHCQCCGVETAQTFIRSFVNSLARSFIHSFIP